MTTLYSFLPSIALTLGGTGATQNTPMNERKIQLHKGILNKFEVKIFNADRKPVNLAHQQIFWRIIQHGFGAVALGPLTVVDASKGKCLVELNDRDIGDMTPGMYHMTFSATDVEGNQTNLYTNLAGSPTIVIEISESLYMESTQANQTMQFNIAQDGWYYTTNFQPRPGTNGVNTVSFRMWDFTGEIKAETTLDNTLNNPKWKILPLESGQNTVSFSSQTQTIGYTVIAEMEQIRFGWKPASLQSGNIDKIIYRS